MHNYCPNYTLNVPEGNIRVEITLVKTNDYLSQTAPHPGESQGIFKPNCTQPSSVGDLVGPHGICRSKLGPADPALDTLVEVHRPVVL